MYYICTIHICIYTSIERVARHNPPDSQWNRHVIVSRSEFLYQPHFDFLLFSESRKYPIVNLNSRKDFWYQDSLDTTTVATPTCRFPKVAGNRRKYLNASYVYFGWKNDELNYRRDSECAISMENHSEKTLSQMFKCWLGFSCNPL